MNWTLLKPPCDDDDDELMHHLKTSCDQWQHNNVQINFIRDSVLKCPEACDVMFSF